MPKIVIREKRGRWGVIGGAGLKMYTENDILKSIARRQANGSGARINIYSNEIRLC